MSDQIADHRNPNKHTKATDSTSHDPPRFTSFLARMNNDFQYVTRPRKSKSRKSNSVPTSPTLASLATTLESIQSHFRTTRLCTRCKGTTLYQKDADLDALGEVLGRLEKPERIVCLGLGSLEDDPRKISFVQLALLMEIQQILKVLLIP